jgi:hypothetical protein
MLGLDCRLIPWAPLNEGDKPRQQISEELIFEFSDRGYFAVWFYITEEIEQKGGELCIHH